MGKEKTKESEYDIVYMVAALKKTIDYIDPKGNTIEIPLIGAAGCIFVYDTVQEADIASNNGTFRIIAMRIPKEATKEIVKSKILKP